MHGTTGLQPEMNNNQSFTVEIKAIFLTTSQVHVLIGNSRTVFIIVQKWHDVGLNAKLQPAYMCIVKS